MIIIYEDSWGFLETGRVILISIYLPHRYEYISGRKHPREQKWYWIDKTDKTLRTVFSKQQPTFKCILLCEEIDVRNPFIAK